MSLEEFGNVIARGGSGVVIASQSGHRLKALTPEQNRLLATMPADELLALPMLQPDQVTDPLHAYQVSKRGNSLRVMAEAVRWGKRGARVNTISPGPFLTDIAEAWDPNKREEQPVALGRPGNPAEIVTAALMLASPASSYTTGALVRVDGGQV